MTVPDNFYHDSPLIVNDWQKINEVNTISEKYLLENPELTREIAFYLWAYHEAGQLVPQTIENITSGHYFPYSSSYSALESSYMLCLLGFYNNSMVSLRSVLELGLLGVYFAVGDMEHIQVQDWLSSNERTPDIKQMNKKFYELEHFPDFDEEFRIVNRIRTLSDELSRYVHTRGYFYSPMNQSGSNVNQFQEKSLITYLEFMRRIVIDVITVMLVKYPIGMVPIPLDQKFGFNGPVGGFLGDHNQTVVVSVLEPKEREYLERVAYGDQWVQGIIEQIEVMPDITQEEMDGQWAEHEATFGSIDDARRLEPEEDESDSGADPE